MVVGYFTATTTNVCLKGNHSQLIVPSDQYPALLQHPTGCLGLT